MADKRKLTRRSILASLAGAGTAALGSAFTSDGGEGNLYGGNMALSEAYNVAGDLWIGPDSARSNVSPNAGRVYMASDDQVEYHGDGSSWVKMGVGSSQNPVPSVHTDKLFTASRLADVVVWQDSGTIYAVDKDGLVDSGSDAATVIQSAFDRQVGQTVYIGAGTYNISSTITVRDAQSIVGTGMDDGGNVTTLKAADGLDAYVLSDASATDPKSVELRNLYIDGNKANQTVGGCVDFMNAADYMVFNCWIDYPYEYGLKINPWNCKVIGNTFEHAGTAGLFAGGGNDLKVTDNKFIYNDKYGVEWKASHSTFKGNFLFQNKEHGMLANGTGPKGSVIHSNHFVANSFNNANTYNGLQVQGNHEDLKITANTFNGRNAADSTNYQRFGLTIASDVQTPVISDNTYVDNVNASFNFLANRVRHNGVVSDTYSGDGTTGRLIDVGFRPSVVYVEGSDGTLYEVRDSGVSAINGSTPSGELSIADDGFTVGDNGADADPNTGSETYQFEAREG